MYGKREGVTDHGRGRKRQDIERRGGESRVGREESFRLAGQVGGEGRREEGRGEEGMGEEGMGEEEEEEESRAVMW